VKTEINGLYGALS